MTETFDNKVIDRRVVKRYVRKGIVDEKEYAAYLKALPDLADQALAGRVGHGRRPRPTTRTTPG